MSLVRVFRQVNHAHRGRKARPAAHGECFRSNPFGQLGHCINRLPNELCQRLGVQAVGQRIDRLDQRQCCELVDLDHVVGVGDLLLAIEEADLPGDKTLFPDRQGALDPAPLGAEEDQLDFARFVMGEDAVGHVRLASGRWLVAVDMQAQGHDLVEIGFGNADLPAPIDYAGGHVHQHVENDRLLSFGRSEKAGEERGQLVAHTLDGVQGSEKWL
ncbi:hypothetical protein D3C87_1260660 [compost metagenome]